MAKYKESKSERIQLQKGKILEQGYSLEALEDEVEHLREVITQKQGRISELIGENDRLTLTYEPYRPPGDEYEGLGFYELIEENDALTQNVLDKIQVIRELEATISELQRPVMASPKKARKNYCGVLSFDFWPLTDWLRLKLYRWSPGKAFQACVGPVRFDFFEG